jgi:hypothetical protein
MCRAYEQVWKDGEIGRDAQSQESGRKPKASDRIGAEDWLSLPHADYRDFGKHAFNFNAAAHI